MLEYVGCMQGRDEEHKFTGQDPLAVICGEGFIKHTNSTRVLGEAGDGLISIRR